MISLVQAAPERQLDLFRGGTFDVTVHFPIMYSNCTFNVLFEVAEYGAPSILSHLFDREDLERRIDQGLLFQAELVSKSTHGCIMECRFQNQTVSHVWNSFLSTPFLTVYVTHPLSHKPALPQTEGAILMHFSRHSENSFFAHRRSASAQCKRHACCRRATWSAFSDVM